MHYKKYKPSPLLKPYVRDYYLWESDGLLTIPFSISSPANTNVAMVFNYGDTYQFYNPRKDGEVLPRQFFSSYSFSPYRMQLRERIGMAGIIFRGATARLLFNLPNLGELIDQRIDLVELIGPETALITEQLGEATTPMKKIQVLEGFLLQRLAAARRGPHLIDHGLNIIFRERGIITMDKLARKLCVSPRQMRRLFQQEAGINPKRSARLKRFGYVNLCLTNNPNFSWHMFLDKGGFYDQSHFIKDYNDFFGKNPSEQLLENRKVLSRLGS